MHISVLGLDIAKQVFQVMGSMCGAGLWPSCAWRRAQVVEYFRALPPCLWVWRLARLLTTARVS